MQFASGELLYLKPRSGGIDRVWNAMLAEVSSSLGIDLPTTSVVDCGSHCWTSAIEPSKQRDSLELFYTQMGVLTFLIFLFQGIDFHCENLIATSRGPAESGSAHQMPHSPARSRTPDEAGDWHPAG